MSDTTKAALLLIGWATLSFLALGIKNAAIGIFIISTLTLVLFLIFYSSWLIEKTEERTRRYIEHQNEMIRRGCENESRKIV